MPRVQEIFNEQIAVGDLGTQLFWLTTRVDKTGTTDPTTSTTGNLHDIYKNTTSGNLFMLTAIDDEEYTWTAYTRKFEYALPVTAGAEFGGDTESFDAPESDLPYIPKVAGRTSLSDITYTSNFTPARYKKWKEIVSSTEDHTFLEVLADGSAMMFSGTGGIPSITAGDVRQINQTIVAKKMEFVANVFDLTEEEVENIASMMKVDGVEVTVTAGSELPFDLDTIPSGRISEVETQLGE